MTTNEIYLYLKSQLFFSPCCEYESKYILSEVLLTPINQISVNADRLLSKSDILKIKRILKKRKAGIPLERIFKKKEFYKNTFLINKDCLSPRSDSETLVEAVLKYANDSKNIIDIGTGSGCLILSIADELKSIKGFGYDISKSALNYAKKNCKNLNLQERIKFKECDFLNKKLDINSCDIFISNPPYIPEFDKKSIKKNVLNYDPYISLFAKDNGLIFYKKIYELLKDKKDIKIFLEHGINQEQEIIKIFKNFSHISIRDYNGINRVLYFFL